MSKVDIQSLKVNDTITSLEALRIRHNQLVDIVEILHGQLLTQVDMYIKLIETLKEHIQNE